MIVQDDRTAEQKRTHPILVVMTDAFMSGWGKAEGGVSYAAWACRSEDEYRVDRWVRNRSDARRVRTVVAKGYRPKGRGHCHIYAVNADHPALR